MSYQDRLSQIEADLNVGMERTDRYFGHSPFMVPDRERIIDIIKLFQSVMFPDYYKGEGTMTEKLERLFFLLKSQLTSAFSLHDSKEVVDTEELALGIMDGLPEIRDMLIKDAQAIYEGDPAAISPEEVILSYPGFLAISVYRIAHRLYTEGIPYIPRVMTEYAHERTGVDIHAGATVGEYFFIDHGTGIVIGETTVIGDRVKLYQGVTLGAKSFELGDDGNPVKGVKRHPNIGNGCIIYANATILGGNTYVGDGSVIGGNVWLTHSVEPGSTVIFDGTTSRKK